VTLDEVGERTFEAIVLDWDGTVVPDRRSDATEARARISSLCAAGLHVFVVSGTNLGNVDGQLQARPSGPGRLHLCLNRGSEVFEVDADGPHPRWGRTATATEQAALDRAGTRVVDELRARGVETALVSARVNRRKIDLIPVAAWCDPAKPQIGELLVAVTDRLAAVGIGGLSEVVALAMDAAGAEGLTDPRITSDGKHVEIGLTDKSDSARWAARWLSERGVTGGLILVGGDELGPLGGVPGSDAHLLIPELTRAAVVSVGAEPGGVPPGVLHVGGGPDRLLDLLDGQLARRMDRRVPSIDDDPAWVVALPAEDAMGRVAESIGTLANGSAGLRATREEDGAGSLPLFIVNGIYTRGAEPHLLPGPLWTNLDVRGPGGDERRLDLRTGVLLRTGGGSPLRSLRFLSAADPELMAMRAEGSAAHLHADATFASPIERTAVEHDDRGAVRRARTTDPGGGGIAVAARDWEQVVDGRRVVERLAAWEADAFRAPTWQRASANLARGEELGFDRLLADHRQAWASLWASAEVSIDGGGSDELAARFAMFHLLGAAPDRAEAAVGARGLTGPAYGGHVFWDADVFVLPALAAVRPRAARAMLEYRLRRLPAARAAAIAAGRRGARFPWESAADGRDVTPHSARGRHGELIPIRTGQREEHVVADAAWAVCEYVAWTGDTAFLDGAGGELVVETARYWASRARADTDGHGHLYGLMGPDEYHEIVDDNAYTNVMARWNLRRAADLVERAGADVAEASRWRTLGESLVDGWHPGRGVYEQFAGYFGLEPLLVADVGRVPVAADVVLGPERVAGSQLIKQADVVMLHHLVPDEVVPGSLDANLAFYEPRTAHGSSLSPAVHAALFARAGQPARALQLFRLAARLDLDDLTGTTSGGLHLATMGGLWQALVYGFLGLRPRPEHLDVDPCLPDEWDALQVRFLLGGSRVCVRATHDAVTFTTGRPLRVRVGGASAVECAPPGQTFPLEARS